MSRDKRKEGTRSLKTCEEEKTQIRSTQKRTLMGGRRHKGKRETGK